MVCSSRIWVCTANEVLSQGLQSIIDHCGCSIPGELRRTRKGGVLIKRTCRMRNSWVIWGQAPHPARRMPRSPRQPWRWHFGRCHFLPACRSTGSTPCVVGVDQDRGPGDEFLNYFHLNNIGFRMKTRHATSTALFICIRSRVDMSRRKGGGCLPDGIAGTRSRDRNFAQKSRISDQRESA